jgi:type IV pilus assembly protein PilY1
VACQTGDANCTNGARWVAFIGGGYDTNQDNDPVTVGDTLGKAVYVVDVMDGSLVKRFSQSDSAYSTTMTYSIPSDVARVDTDGDGKVNRLYVGDMGGRMWRFDVESSDSASWSGRIIFQSNPGGDASTGRKIFYPPDVTLEVGYEMLFFGTGDREHPQNGTVSNRIYAVKDKNLGSPLVETNLYDVTDDELQWSTTTATRKDEILTALDQAYGWYIILGTGEKSLATPVVFYGIAYFTTFSPEEGTDPCQAQFGTARMYALDYKTAMAVFDFDGNGTIGASDVSTEIGTAIPSGVIITFIEGTAVAYTGVGGGVDSPVLPNTKSIVPIYWRTVF